MTFNNVPANESVVIRLFALSIVLVSGLQAQTPAARTPVLLELFTSEGCSSCPPADKLLAEIDKKQPVAAAQLIVLSEHVDYWNRQGWTDPFSSHALTERQEMYAARFGTEDIYTPELVVDGARSLVGSDWKKAESAIRESLREAKTPVNVTAKRNEADAQIHVNVGSSVGRKDAIVYLVLAHDRTQSHVAHGENAGRDLTHVAVAYSIREIAKVKPDATFDQDIRVPLAANSKAGDTRAVVFVKKEDATRVIGAGETRF